MEVPRICRSSVAFKASSAKWFLKYSWADFIVGSGGGFCLYSRRSPTSNELTSSSLQQMITSLKSRKKNTYAHSMIQCICHVCIPLQTEHSRCRNGATFLHWKKGLLSKLVSATIKTLHMCNRETTYWIKHQLPWCEGCMNSTNTNQWWYMYLSCLAPILWDPEQLSWHIYRTDCVHTQGNRCAYCRGHILLFSTIAESEQCS